MYCSLTSGYPLEASAQPNAYIRVVEELMHYILQHINVHHCLRLVTKSTKHYTSGSEADIGSATLLRKCYHPHTIQTRDLIGVIMDNHRFSLDDGSAVNHGVGSIPSM